VLLLIISLIVRGIGVFAPVSEGNGDFALIF
jgi:hypothetical protein